MTKEEIKQVDDMTLEIMAHLNNMLSGQDCEHYIKLTPENATVFFTALNNAVCATLSSFVDECHTFIDAQHMFNKLLFQYTIRDESKND